MTVGTLVLAIALTTGSAFTTPARADAAVLLSPGGHVSCRQESYSVASYSFGGRIGVHAHLYATSTQAEYAFMRVRIDQYNKRTLAWERYHLSNWQLIRVNAYPFPSGNLWFRIHGGSRDASWNPNFRAVLSLVWDQNGRDRSWSGVVGRCFIV